MRNYTLNTVKDYRLFGDGNTFTEKQKAILIERKYTYYKLFNTWKKHIAGFTEIVLDMDKKKLYFYRSTFFTPAELDTFFKDKAVLNDIKAEVKFLRDNGFFTQKK